MQIVILLTLLLCHNLEVSSNNIEEWGERKPDDELFFSEHDTYELIPYSEKLYDFYQGITEEGKNWPYEINMIRVESYERDWKSINISVSTAHKSANVAVLYEIDWGYDWLMGPTQEIKVQAWRTWRQYVEKN